MPGRAKIDLGSGQLTADLAKFVEEYRKDWNATRACIRCGFYREDEERKARSYGHTLLQLPAVRKAVIDAERAQAAEIRTETKDIAQALADLAHLDPLDVFTDNGDVRPLSEIPPHARRAIAGIDVETKVDKEGTERITKRVRFWDKKGALELLGKYRKLFTDKIEVGGEGLKVEVKIE